MAKKLDLEKLSREELGAYAVRGEVATKQMVDAIGGSSRIARQHAAGGLCVCSEEKPDRLVPYAAEIVDALYRPEAKTRWECLDTLTNIVALDARACDKGVAGAEQSLYDEESGPVRLAAFRFLCAYGATTETRSEKVWPLIDEAIQCYHGDPEFQDMLTALLEFTQGNASKEVKKQIVARMKFDADSGHGLLKRRASQIVTEARKRK